MHWLQLNYKAKIAQMTLKRKVFISYHHGSKNQNGNKYHKEQFESELTAKGINTYAVKEGEIDPNEKVDKVTQIIRDKYLKNSEVTIVLIGKNTWRRKHVDWEIAASIAGTKDTSKSGLVGVFLPSHPFYTANKNNQRRNRPPSLEDTDQNGVCYYQTIPPRLWDNIQCGYAPYHFWPELGRTPLSMTVPIVVEQALENRDREPNNDRHHFRDNRSKKKQKFGWQDT